MTLQVPGLGSIRGLLPAEFENVEQYRGIPYGTVSARFQQAKLVTAWPDGKWDGTKYGPLCPFPKIAIGHPITQKHLPPQHGYDFEEFRCLNLNVTCPAGGSALPNGLPVIVWVHGGGNCVGTAADPGYDGGPLVHFSLKRKQPVIVVTVNYRLGAFGFLASDAIKEDNKAAGDQGFGNYGIRDQLLAYEWVKQNIKAFGGDPNRITGMGESAGSIDTHITLCSELFKSALPFNQAILQSGVGSLTVRTAKHQQGVYQKLLTHLKIDANTSESLKALRAVSADDLVAAYIALGSGPVPAWQATVDDYFLTTNCSVSSLAQQQYHSSVKRLLIGDCEAEGLIFSMPLSKREWTFDKVQSLASQVLGEQDAQVVLQAYGISASLSYEELFASLIKLVSDAEWSQPIREVAKSFSNGDVFYYHLTEGNPFEGAHKGKAHHAVDLIYVFLTYQSHLPDNLAALAETIASNWISFVNRGQPWSVYDGKLDGSSKVMVFGPNGGSVEKPESSKPAYKGILLCEELQDKIGRFAASLHGKPAVE